MIANDDRCYCCSGKIFGQCCQPYLSGKNKAGSPEQLMRSRYSAFCSHDSDYLRATHHPKYQTLDDGEALDKALETTRWLGLKIVGAKENTVEFCAFYRDLTASGMLTTQQTQNTTQQLHEKSHFVFEDNQWYYTEGTMLPPVKLGRNDACYCGSERKYKQCCGAN